MLERRRERLALSVRPTRRAVVLVAALQPWAAREALPVRRAVPVAWLPDVPVRPVERQRAAPLAPAKERSTLTLTVPPWGRWPASCQEPRRGQPGAVKGRPQAPALRQGTTPSALPDVPVRPVKRQRAAPLAPAKERSTLTGIVPPWGHWPASRQEPRLGQPGVVKAKPQAPALRQVTTPSALPVVPVRLVERQRAAPLAPAKERSTPTLTVPPWGRWPASAARLWPARASPL